MEYFEAIGDARYKYYKERMCSIIVKNEPLLGPKPEQAVSTHRAAESLLRRHESQTFNASKELQRNLVSQAATLETRLVQRHKLRSCASANALLPARRRALVEGDVSGGQGFESELEAVIEKAVTEQVRAVQAVREKYLAEETAVAAMGMTGTR